MVKIAGQGKISNKGRCLVVEDVGLYRKLGWKEDWLGSMIGDEVCVIRDCRYGDWILGSELSESLRAFHGKQVKQASCVCATAGFFAGARILGV